MTLTYLDNSGFTAEVYNDTVSLVQANAETTAVSFVGAIINATAGFENAPESGVSRAHPVIAMFFSPSRLARLSRVCARVCVSLDC